MAAQSATIKTVEPKKIYISIEEGKIISTEDLKSFFTQSGKVTGINQPEGKSYAFVTFDEEETAKQLIGEEVEVAGVKLKIKEAVRTSLKRTNESKNQKRRDKDTKRARKYFAEKKKKQNETRKAAPGCTNGCFVKEDYSACIWKVEVAITEESDKSTGGLYDCIRDSFTIAKTSVKRLLKEIDPGNDFFEKNKFFHMNISNLQAVKSGHSVGFSLAVDLLSLALNTGIDENLAFTGEIGVHGEIREVGAVRQKIEGARSAGIKTIFIPMANKKDVKSVNFSEINIKFINNVVEVVDILFKDRTSSAQMNKITDDFIKKLSEKVSLVTMERKSQEMTVPEDQVTADIRKFKVQGSHSGLHSDLAVLAVDISIADTNKIVTGGADKNATVFNKETETQVVQLKGHTKKVNRVVYHMKEDVVITGSHDNTVRVWNAVTGNCGHVLRVHDGPVTGLGLHPTGDFVLTTSSDQHWTFSDINTGQLVSRVTDTNNPVPLTCAQFHPDGLIFGTGAGNSVKIWDLKEQINVADFHHEGLGQISALSFSENGYYVATAGEYDLVKLWDLRTSKTFQILQLGPGYELKDICFNSSGSYLAVAGSDVRVYQCKQWEILKVVREHQAISTGVRFGKHAQYLATTSMDRTLKIYSPETPALAGW